MRMCAGNHLENSQSGNALSQRACSGTQPFGTKSKRAFKAVGSSHLSLTTTGVETEEALSLVSQMREPRDFVTCLG